MQRCERFVGVASGYLRDLRYGCGGFGQAGGRTGGRRGRRNIVRNIAGGLPCGRARDVAAPLAATSARTSSAIGSATISAEVTFLGAAFLIMARLSDLISDLIVAPLGPEDRAPEAEGSEDDQ